jgi:hypothetical protein
MFKRGIINLRGMLPALGVETPIGSARKVKRIRCVTGGLTFFRSSAVRAFTAAAAAAGGASAVSVAIEEVNEIDDERRGENGEERGELLLLVC